MLWQGELKRHLLEVHQEETRCKFCKLVLEDSYELKKHMAQEHFRY